MTKEQVQELAKQLAGLGLLVAGAAGAPVPTLTAINALFTAINTILVPQLEDLVKRGLVTVEQQREVKEVADEVRKRLGIPEPVVPTPVDPLAPPPNGGFPTS